MDFDYITTFFSATNFFIFVISCFLLILLKSSYQGCYPPGPNIFVGSRLVFKKYAFRYINELTQKYGPIFKFSVFGHPIVVLGNYEILKEAYTKYGDNFLDRQRGCAIEEYCNYKGVIFSNGEIWKESRKFAITFLLKFDFLESVESIILQEAEFACNEINKKNGQSFDASHLIVKLTNNVIMRLTCSERSDYDIPYDFIKENTDEVMQNFRTSNPINFFSPLKYILKSHKKYLESIANLKAYLIKIIKNHENTFDENNIRDYVDAFLAKQFENEKEGTPNSTYTRENLIQMVVDFFIAGTDTSSVTLLWGIILLLHHPHIQTKIQKEIDDIIGTSRCPTTSDMIKLPYTQASIFEIQRYANIAPMALARSVTQDMKLGGYDIPKGTSILPNLTALHFDTLYWKDPNKFDPDRFLDEKISKAKVIPSFIPFGIGHRDCAGITLAKKEVFLLFTFFLQRYSFKYQKAELPSLTEGIEGSVIKPMPFEVSFIPR